MSAFAVITGAGGGIGTGVVAAALAAGYRVAAWDMDEDALRAQPWASDVRVTYAVVDTTDEASMERVAAQFNGVPNLLVNCAGISAGGSLLEISGDDWRRVLDVNLTGTFLCSRVLAHRMSASGGAIVNVASVNGLAPGRNTGPYSASKAGVIRLTEQMAVEWAPLSIRVNAVAPGVIDAGLARKSPMSADVSQRRTVMIPLQRNGTIEDVADAIMFLASDKANYITGATLVVDGGLVRTAMAALPTSYDTVPKSN